MKKILIILMLILISGCGEMQQIKECVPASCCHPTGCVLIEDKPDCKGMICTMECKPGTLDCGQGHCEYINGKCEAVLNG